MSIIKPSLTDPIRVYLDSSDIDNLSDSRKLEADKRLGETREALKEFAARGIAEYRFSFFHIIELSHTDERSKPFALRRAELVKTLCDKKAFLNTDKLWRLEALSLALDNETETAKGSKARAYVEDSGWLPETIVAISNRFANSLIKALKNRIEAKALSDIPATRANRRGVKRRIFGRQGLTKYGDEIASKTPNLLEDRKGEFPLTKRFWDEDMPLQYLQNKVSLEELLAECLAGFGEIENFVGWCIDKVPSMKDLPKAIRGTEQAQIFQQLREKAGSREKAAKEIFELLEPEAPVRKRDLEELHEALQDATIPDLNKSRAKDLDELYSSNRAWFGQQGVRPKEWESRVGSSSLGALPSFDTSLQVNKAQFTKMAKLSTDARKLKRSDLSDMLHCVYLPYVDLFRADDYTRDLIRDVAKTTCTTLVPSTLALPDAIRREAASRGVV